MRLSEAINGKENNLNLVRFFAAFAVIVSHAFVLVTGKLDSEPWRIDMGMSLGDIAVDVFFAVSGFLVSGSLLARRDALGFLRARALRILPALVVMVFACIFLIGLPFSQLGPVAFLRSTCTWRFALSNLTLVRGVQMGLPGVFLDLPWKNVVNGSLWTLVYEVRLYLSLVVFWLVAMPFGARLDRVFRILCVAAAVATLGWYVHVLTSPIVDPAGIVDPVPRLALQFYMGVCWRFLAPKVVLDWRFACAWLVACGILHSIDRGPLFHATFALGLPYIVWCAGFFPSQLLRRFNRCGDSSYGIYIYGFPIQQLLVATIPGCGAATLIAVGGAASVGLGFLSWHLVEKRALAWKSKP